MKLFFVICLLIFPLSAVAQSELPTGRLEHDGMERTFRLFLPPTYDDGEPLPLLVALHPAGTDGAGMAQITRFDELALAENFIVVYPDGPGGYWDYGAGFEEWDVVPDVRDDPGYIEALVAHLDEKLTIDKTQIYAVGFSNGARMAYRLGCEYPEIFKGIGMVAATISEEIINHCAENAQPSVIFMHGTADGVIPWEGKTLYFGSTPVSKAISAPETVAYWVEKNGCTDEVATGEIIDLGGDRTIVPEFYNNCEIGSKVAFYPVENGAHLWFRTDNFDSAQVIWTFFMAQP